MGKNKVKKVTLKVQRYLEQVERGQRFTYKLGYFEVTDKTDPQGIEVELISGHHGRLLPGERTVLPRKTHVTIKVKEKVRD